MSSFFLAFILGLCVSGYPSPEDLEETPALTDTYELRTVWVWEKEIQLQIQNKDHGLIINLTREKRSLLKADVTVYSEAEADQEFKLSDAELKNLIFDATRSTTKTYFKFFGDRDEFFGMQIDFRKRLYENDLRTHEKFLPKLVALIKESAIQQKSWCVELLTRNRD